MQAFYMKEKQVVLDKIVLVSKRFWKDEEGLGTLEMLMILAVLVIIAIAFRKWIIRWVNSLFTQTNTEITDTSNAPAVTEP